MTTTNRMHSSSDRVYCETVHLRTVKDTREAQSKPATFLARKIYGKFDDPFFTETHDQRTLQGTVDKWKIFRIIYICVIICDCTSYWVTKWAANGMYRKLSVLCVERQTKTVDCNLAQEREKQNYIRVEVGVNGRRLYLGLTHNKIQTYY